ncbi:MAG TPA: hypothetical protein VEM93_07535 [Actinomycetota bacterium]|nr:hypothetical protein [Actinomycetota bacterium]
MNRRERRNGGDPVESLQQEARWSGFTNSWNRTFHADSRRARVFALAWVLLFVAIAFIGLTITIFSAIASAK